jgi:LysR family transcriptional regulator, regulator for bpeEF and oprC
MEYQSSRGALEELDAFVAVVDAGGFTAAARKTEARKATLSKRVQDLEARLGVPLLVRTTRSLRLTEEGSAYLEHARRSLASARDAEAVVVSARARPRGQLRVAIASTMAAFVMDGVIEFLKRYPEVTLHLDTADRQVDLVRERFDLAVRVGPLPDSSLVAKRLGSTTGGYFASPAYVKRRGRPKTPRDLASHATIVVPKGGRVGEWPFFVRGKTRLVQVGPRLVVTDIPLAVRAAVTGLGIVRAPLAAVRPALAAKHLVPVLAKWTIPPLDVHAVYPPGGSLVPKTRAFLEMLAHELGRY